MESLSVGEVVECTLTSVQYFFLVLSYKLLLYTQDQRFPIGANDYHDNVASMQGATLYRVIL